MLINFYFHLRCYLLLGSSTRFGFGAAHIFISRKLCYNRCACAPTYSLLLLSLFSSTCGSAYIKTFPLFSFCACNAFSFIFSGCVFIYTTSARTNRKLLFFDLINMQHCRGCQDWRFPRRRFARERRQFVTSSSFNPFPLDRLLGRPTPPWVP